MQKAEVDDDEVVPEEEVLSSEESVKKEIVVAPPLEIVIPAAGVLVEKGQEYQMEQDQMVGMFTCCYKFRTKEKTNAQRRSQRDFTTDC